MLVKDLIVVILQGVVFVCFSVRNIRKPSVFNLLATDFFFQILAHPVFKM